MRLPAVWLCLLMLSSCRCANGPSLGPLEEPRPASLGDTGLLVDHPPEGAAVDAQWVTVSGWVDRSRYTSVAVVGAASTTFYAAGGHVGIPSVPVLVREDGRFFAPRVPLDQGTTQVLIIAITSEATAGAQAERQVTSNHVGTPATIVTSPAEGGRAPLSVTFEPHAAEKVDNWQWDYNGDGRFDEEKLTGKHEYATAGSQLAFARTRIRGLWVWAVAPVQVTGPDDVTHQSTQVTTPRAVVVVAKRVDLEALQRNDGAIAAMDPLSLTQAVLVPDGDVVKIFDPQLNLVRTLSGGLNAPQGAAQDGLGRTYVADTGNNRVVRFAPDGTLDPTFADAGVLAVADGLPIISPTTVLVTNGWNEPDGGFDVDLKVATADRVIDCPKLGSCSGDPGPTAQRLIRTQSAMGGRDNPWLLKDGKLLRDSDLSPRNSGDDALDAALGGSSYNPWWVVLRPGGRLEERFSTVSNVRVNRLGFEATAIAVDGSADYILFRRLGDDRSSRITGPHVIYVAGPGHLERRVLPQMSEGLW